jgi:hypothetical protein
MTIGSPGDHISVKQWGNHEVHEDHEKSLNESQTFVFFVGFVVQHRRAFRNLDLTAL